MYIKIADQHLIPPEVIPDDEAGYLRIHHPVKHAHLAFNDRVEVSVYMDGHHRLV